MFHSVVNTVTIVMMSRGWIQNINCGEIFHDEEEK
jgi:hypothetical protein